MINSSIQNTYGWHTVHVYQQDPHDLSPLNPHIVPCHISRNLCHLCLLWSNKGHGNMLPILHTHGPSFPFINHNLEFTGQGASRAKLFPYSTYPKIPIVSFGSHITHIYPYPSGLLHRHYIFPYFSWCIFAVHIQNYEHRTIFSASIQGILSTFTNIFHCHFISIISSHILQGFFTGTEAIIWLPQCQLRNLEEYW